MGSSVSLWAGVMVAGGGALGALARWAVGLVGAALFGAGVPWATVVVNLVGSFLMGCLAAVLAPSGALFNGGLRLFAVTGFLGAFTTFSTFSLDVVTLWQRGDVGAACLYSAGSVAAGVLALAVGLALGSYVVRVL